MKYIVAVVGFIFIWFFSSFLIGLLMVLIFKPEHNVVVGVGLDWLNIPGTIIGFFAGLHSAKVTIRRANAKERKNESDPKDDQNNN